MAGFDYGLFDNGVFGALGHEGCLFDEQLFDNDVFDVCEEEAPVAPRRVGGGSSWQDHVTNRYRSINGLVAKVKREQVKLEKRAEKIERTIAAERRQNRPIEGILARYWDISQKIEAKKEQIFRLELEYKTLDFGNEEDEEILLLYS